MVACGSPGLIPFLVHDLGAKHAKCTGKPGCRRRMTEFTEAAPKQMAALSSYEEDPMRSAGTDS